jgi:pimeloyl-ACP methyl ester carboxylesterase
VALQFASRNPQAVSGLVLIDPVFRAALRGQRRAQILMRWPLAGLAALLAGLNRLGLGRQTLGPLDLRALDQQARIALRSPAGKAEFIRHYSSMRADLKHIRTGHYLQEMAEMLRPLPALTAFVQDRLPILVLLSTGATFADASTTRAIAAGLSSAVRIVDIDCEHWPLTERPAEVRTAIEAWLGLAR